MIAHPPIVNVPRDGNRQTLAPFKKLAMKAPDISVERRADGCVLIRSNHAMGTRPRSIAHLLAERAAAHPDRDYMMQRLPGHGPWRRLTYGEALRQAEAIAAFLLASGAAARRGVMVLSGNSIEHAVITLGCHTAGVPVTPISAAYSLLSADHAKLCHCIDTVRPGIVFAQSGAAFGHALETLRRLDPSLIFVTADAVGKGGFTDTISLATILATPPGGAVARARDEQTDDTVIKYLFTSGSTGMPKAALQTNGMLTAVISGLNGLRSGDVDPDFVPPSLEWMPWSHLSAGNIGFNGVLWSGGTVFLDEGKPVPGLFETTIRNLYEVSPVIFGSAPIAFAMLAEAMERDAVLRRCFFKNLEYMAYGGATLANDVYDRMQALAVAETGMRVPLITMYGSTETQGVTMNHWITERAGVVGLPLPGITLKLVPKGGKMEVRVRGPTVTPGYLSEKATADAFDSEGFYMLGDAVRFIDDKNPIQGLLFDGRLGEDFKLSSGTWVSAGVLRPVLIAACSPYVQDAVIAGQDQAYIGALVWPSAAAREAFAEGDGVFSAADFAAAVALRLREHNETGTGSSRRVCRLLVLADPPSIDAGEITDKGYVNQRAVLTRRAAMVETLFAEPPAATVTLI